MRFKKVIVVCAALALGGCADLTTRISTLENNQKQLVGAVNLLASCKKDSDPTKPVTSVPCPIQVPPAPAAPAGK